MSAKSPTERFQQANELFAERRFAEALIILDELDAAHPNNERLMRAKVLCYLALQKTYQAYALVDAMEKAFGKEGLRDLRAKLTTSASSTGAAAKTNAPLPGSSDPNHVTLDVGNGELYVIDLLGHDVQRVERAKEKFVEDAHPDPAMKFGAAILAFIGMPIAALVLAIVDGAVQGDPVPFNLFAAGLLISWPFTVAKLCWEGASSRLFSKRTPKRSTPEETVRTFLQCLRSKSWKTAYNCLTDGAMMETNCDFKRSDYLSTSMPSLSYCNPGEFVHFWEKTPFAAAIAFGRSSIRCEYLDLATAKVSVRLRLAWRADAGRPWRVKPLADQGEQDRTYREVITWTFLLTRCGGFWYLCNGFYWPVGSKYKGAWLKEHSGQTS